jgi:PAS domain S-box-containing protein
MHPAPTGREPPAPAPAPDPDVEAVLRDPAVLWQAVQSTTGEYVVIVDRAGIIRSCNRIDDGFTVDQVVGHSIARFTVPESSAALVETLEQVFADGQMRSLETTVRGLDESLNYFALRLAPIRSAGRNVAVMVCCASIRPLKTTEHALMHERNLLRRLLAIQERERQLVSYEIHDGLAQYLVSGLMHLQACRRDDCPVEMARELDEGIRLMQAAAAESRRLIGGLRPPALDELGLAAAVESIVDDARADIPDVTFAHDLPPDRLPESMETTVFRIVQEAITNARRHSRARRLRVGIGRADGGVRIVVEDDGRGFDPAAVPDDRFGLEGIRQRSRLLGGRPRIESAPGKGTTIEVTIPELQP